MRSQLMFLGLVTIGFVLGSACAPIDGENDALTNHEWMDAEAADVGEADAEVDDEEVDVLWPTEDGGTAPGADEDAGEEGSGSDGGVASDSGATSVPPVVPPVVPDAGTTPKPDAGTPKPDAGTPDAGTPKPDAGTPDAGTPKPDAGTPDAGTPKPDAGTPDAGTPKPDAGTPDAGTPSTTKFRQVYAIISEKCAFCHVADHIGLQLGHLDMSTAYAAYGNLVGKEAAGIDCGGTGHVRVVAGNPAQSLIIQKLKGTADCGVQMPDNYPPLSAAQIEVFRSWIEAGAKND